MNLDLLNKEIDLLENFEIKIGNICGEIRFLDEDAFYENLYNAHDSLETILIDLCEKKNKIKKIVDLELKVQNSMAL